MKWFFVGKGLKKKENLTKKKPNRQHKQTHKPIKSNLLWLSRQASVVCGQKVEAVTELFVVNLATENKKQQSW